MHQVLNQQPGQTFESHIDLNMNLCSFAPIMEDVVQLALKASGDDYPGVVEYEVSEGFGTWYGRRVVASGIPDRSSAIDAIKELVYSFFKQNGEHYHTSLSHALSFCYEPEPAVA